MFQFTCSSKVSLMSFYFSLNGGCFTYKIVCLCLSLCVWSVFYLRNFVWLSHCDGSYLRTFLSLSVRYLRTFVSLSLSLIRILPIWFFFLTFFLTLWWLFYFLSACVLSLYGRCFGYEIFRALSLFMVGIYSQNFVFFSPSMYDRCFTSRLCVSLSVNGGYLTYEILVSLSLYTPGFLETNFCVYISLWMVDVSHIKFCVSLFLNGGRTIFCVRLSFCMVSVLLIIFCVSFSLIGLCLTWQRNFVSLRKDGRFFT